MRAYLPEGQRPPAHLHTHTRETRCWNGTVVLYSVRSSPLNITSFCIKYLFFNAINMGHRWLRVLLKIAQFSFGKCTRSLQKKVCWGQDMAGGTGCLVSGAPTFPLWLLCQGTGNDQRQEVKDPWLIRRGLSPAVVHGDIKLFLLLQESTRHPQDKNSVMKKIRIYTHRHQLKRVFGALQLAMCVTF